jgi:hypothetical protein
MVMFHSFVSLPEGTSIEISRSESPGRVSPRPSADASNAAVVGSEPLASYHLKTPLVI